MHLLALLGCLALADDPPLQAGDLVFHTSSSAQSVAIARATGSPLTHVGVVLEHEGRLQVFEAVQPVGWAELDGFRARGRDEQVWRLADAHTVLTPAVLARMGELADGWAGRDYDVGFAWSDEQLYCSEAVYKLYERGAGIRLGTVHTLADYHLDDPVVARAMHERWGAAPPLGERMIAPVDLTLDERLVRVR